MNKINYYLKFLGIFLLVELFLTLFSSILNLLGVNSGITTLFMFIANIIVFIILNFKNATRKLKKGLLEGLKLGSLMIIVMILLKLLILKSNFSIATYTYYLILLVSSILGALFGVNKKSEN